MQSKLNNIYLALCYYSMDLKVQSWKAVLAPLIHEFRTLETRGVDLLINGAVVKYKVILSCKIGANLFLNSVLGFVESLTVHLPSRHCMVQHAEFANVLMEDCTLVRNEVT